MDEYLKEKGLKEADFGLSVGLSQGQINRLRYGKSKTSWAKALKIERETGGLVTLADLGFSTEEAA